MQPPYAARTGLPSLDAVVQGLLPGDNVVWQVDRVEDYAPFVRPFVVDAARAGKRLVYFRFARHAPLVSAGDGAEIHELQPSIGFESFTASIHRVIEACGRGAYYVFDCLSELAADWYSDLMLGNFFQVTCPYLYELDTVTYFGLLRDSHSHEAVESIRSTTQLLVDVFSRDGATYVHPLKVFGRASPTMYLPHVREGETFRPLTDSARGGRRCSPDLSERRLDALGAPRPLGIAKFLSWASRSRFHSRGSPRSSGPRERREGPPPPSVSEGQIWLGGREISWNAFGIVTLPFPG